MSEILPGKVLTSELGSFEATLKRGYVFIWRELPQGAEATVWTPGDPLPSAWLGSSYPWKAIGEHPLLEELWRSKPPQGSRPLTVRGEARLQVNLRTGALRFQGTRHKKILIVDDSPTIRKLLRHMVESLGDWEVVGELPDPRDMGAVLDKLLPDVVTLDLHMGEMDGAQAMRSYLSPRRIPTILISSQPKEDGGLVMEALAAGAMDYMQKPQSGELQALSADLKQKFETLLRSRWHQNGMVRWKPCGHTFQSLEVLISIGSSTGGTQALQDILLSMPKEIPPILITQHIPPVFSAALAKRFNDICPFEVKEAQHGDEILPNRVLIAPGGHHMRLSIDGKRVCIEDDEPINRFRPSVDALFSSVAKNARVPVVAAILTGMGRDGAQGLLELRRAGHHTIAQDEKSSVVFGMPKAAIELGAAVREASLDEMTQALIEGAHGEKARLKKTV